MTLCYYFLLICLRDEGLICFTKFGLNLCVSLDTVSSFSWANRAPSLSSHSTWSHFYINSHRWISPFFWAQNQPSEVRNISQWKKRHELTSGCRVWRTSVHVKSTGGRTSAPLSLIPTFQLRTAVRAAGETSRLLQAHRTVRIVFSVSNHHRHPPPRHHHHHHHGTVTDSWFLHPTFTRL